MADRLATRLEQTIRTPNIKWSILGRERPLHGKHSSLDEGSASLWKPDKRCDMTPETSREAARAIADARRNQTLLAKLPTELTPETLEDGYAIQRDFMEIWPERLIGWKVGATAEKVQEIYGLSEPFFGPLYDGTVFHSPAAAKAERFGYLCIESEFAFRFGRDLPVRDEPYRLAEILDAIDVVIPVMELISPRFETLLTDAAPLAVADCGINGGLVLGTLETAWRDINIPAHPVRFSVDGQLREEGTGARVLGDPFNVLEWTVKALARHGLSLSAGQLISTGTCTGFHYVDRGQLAVADFGSLGEVSVLFAS